jgi:hypothetical protein
LGVLLNERVGLDASLALDATSYIVKSSFLDLMGQMLDDLLLLELIDFGIPSETILYIFLTLVDLFALCLDCDTSSSE